MAEIAGSAEGGGLLPPAPLGPQHDLTDFDCGVPVLNDWLCHRALRNEGRFSRSYVVAAGTKVAGYYCISAGSVERAVAPGSVRRNAPDMVPICILGRLAVDRRYTGRGLGADLLSDALHRIVGVSEIIGITAVLVHAKDEAARRFYLRCPEFQEYPADSRILFLPMNAIRAAAG